MKGTAMKNFKGWYWASAPLHSCRSALAADAWWKLRRRNHPL
jgi:hypothetical protein